MATRTLDRILQSQGFGTRKSCVRAVRQGRVLVAGAKVSDPNAIYELEDLAVRVDDVEWRCVTHSYLALHKPAGVECSRKPSHHPGVMTLLPEHVVTRGVQPVGRLDQDTTGLLLLTDDGAFNHALSSPKRHVPKRYRVKTLEVVTDKLIEALLSGVLLHGEKVPTAADACVRLGELELELTIATGKYHQVKRMIAAGGNSCVGLHRAAIAGLELGAMGLGVGEHRPLTGAELASLGGDRQASTVSSNPKA